MPESQPCPICGGSHAPDACPAAKKDEIKPEKVLTPEEMRERSEMQNKLEEHLSNGWTDKTQKLISFAEQKGIVLDFSNPKIIVAIQKGLESDISHIGARRIGRRLDAYKESISFAEQNGIALDFSKPEIVSACEKRLEWCLENGRIDDAQKIITFAKENSVALDIFSVCQKIFEMRLSDGLIDDALEVVAFAKQNNVALDFSNKNTQEKFAICLAGGVVEKLGFWSLPPEVFDAIDGGAAQSDKLIEKNLIKFVKSLGNKEFSQKFPKTFERVIYLIQFKISGDQDLADYFLENLDKYYQQSWVGPCIKGAVFHYSVAVKFISASKIGKKLLIFDSDDGDNAHFEEIKDEDKPLWINEPWVTDVLASAKALVDKQQKQSAQDHDDDSDYQQGGNDGFKETDPYENHPWRFDKNQILISEGIKRMLAGEDIQELLVERQTKEVKREYKIKIKGAGKKQQLEWQQDVDEDEISEPKIVQKEIKVTLTPELQEALLDIRKKVDEAHNDFLQSFSNSPFIPEEDKTAIADPDYGPVKMNNLLPNVRAFVARYITQLCEGNVNSVGNAIHQAFRDIERILQEGYRRYFKMYEVDIPLYDKLYDEFDHWRDAGRYPLEVYLGRDGIYAHIGRHAQDAARRGKLGHEGRKGLKERGEVFEINPKYLVYPRYFRDNLSYDTKR